MIQFLANLRDLMASLLAGFHDPRLALIEARGIPGVDRRPACVALSMVLDFRPSEGGPGADDRLLPERRKPDD